MTGVLGASSVGWGVGRRLPREPKSNTDIDVVVMPDQEDLRGVHSALGQDILSRWRVLHDPAAGALLGTVLSADWTVRPR